MAGENQQTTPLAQIPDDSTPQPQPQPAPVVTDIDEIELRDALTAAEAEKAAGGTPPDDKSGQAAPQPQAQVQPAPKDPADVPMIPKPRLDQALEAQRKAEQNAAYWQGQAEARAPAPGAQPQPQATPAPAQTPEQKLLDIRTEKQALARKVDDGELTMADYEEKRFELDEKAHAIREEGLLTKIKPAAPAAPQTGADELYLETLTAQLEDQHPWVKVASAEGVGTDTDWQYVRSRAIDNMIARGIDPTKGQKAVRDYNLRKEICVVWDELGPGLLTARATAKGVALPTGQQSKTAAPQPATKPALSPEAQARAAKLAVAAGAPPNLAAMTNSGGGDGTGTPSDAALEAMTDEEIGALPTALRNKLRGIAA